MRPFRDIPLRSKLMLIIMATTCAALVMGGSALIVRYTAAEEGKETERLTTLAKVVSANIAAAVSFHEPASATETLAALIAEPNILAAYVYDSQGTLFAEYTAPKANAQGPPLGVATEAIDIRKDWTRTGSFFGGDTLSVSGPIILDGERIGTILLKTDLRQLRLAVLVDIGTLSLIIVVAGLMALFLSSALQRVVSEPIVRLAQTMRRVSQVKDYGVRVWKVGDDEVGTLIDGFNEMLEQINVRDTQLESRRAQLEDAQHIARMGNWEWDPAQDRLSLSRSALGVMALADEPSAETLEAFLLCIHPTDRERVGNAIRTTAQSGAPFDLENRIVSGSEVRFVHLKGEARGEDAHQPRRVVGSVQDISERVSAEQQLRIAANALESTGDSIVITDRLLNIVSVNRAFSIMTGYSREEAEGRHPGFLLSAKHDGSFFDSLLRQVGDVGHWRGEIWQQRRDGEAFPLLMSVSEVKDATGAVSHFVLVGSDISHYKRYEADLEFLARHDVLTQLPNRGWFLVQLHEAILRAQRHGDRIGIMFVDLDHFKEINDTLGHDIGDQLLKTAASRIKNCLRESDVVARLGGDEFTVLVEEAKSAQDIATVAQKIIDKLSQSFHLAGQDLFVTASIGIACYPDDGNDEDALMKNADVAMYSAKVEGRNRYRIFAHDEASQPASGECGAPVDGYRNVGDG